jgi:hypothetical protein
MTTRIAPTRPMIAAAPPARRPSWGWLEWYWVIQTLLPALLFIPGASVLRTLVRVASFLIALVAWLAIWRSGRTAPAGKPFPATPWLTACVVLLGLMVFHPGTNSLASGLAQAAMYLTVLSPVYWAPAALTEGRQLSRVMNIVFLGATLNAFLGLAQVYRPTVFNPPYIPSVHGGSEISRGGAVYLSASGDEIIRPCGLSDNPGQASGAASIACLIGLSLAVRPIAGWKRIACLGVAFVSIMVLYFGQIRSAMVMAFVCIAAMGALFAARGYYRQATLLGIGSLVMLIGGAIAAVAVVGDVATKRFMTLFESRPDEVYSSARGRFVQETFDRLMWEYPVGAGLGRWGQAYGVFGDYEIAPGKDGGQIWVEVQWPGWVVDGGIPLMIMYVTAVVLAMADSFRIALTCRDRELGYWAAVICALNLTTVANCFSACPFVANTGMGFWLSAAILHAADLRVRQEARRREARRRAPAVHRPA